MTTFRDRGPTALKVWFPLPQVLMESESERMAERIS
jgi:hypothetical protein